MATGRRRGRAIFYIAFIVILLLVLVFVVTRMNTPLSPKPPAASNAPVATPVPTADTIEIVFTTQDIQRGQVLKQDLIKLVPIPRENYTEGLFYVKKDMDGLLESRAKYDLKAHTPLTNALIFAAGSPGSLPSFEIPAGKVAISVPISKLSSVAYGLQKGDHVNILVSLLMVDIDTNFQSILPNRTGSVIAPGPISENQTYVTAQVMGPPGYETGGSGSTYLGRIEIDPTLNNPVYLLPSEPQRPRLVSQTLIQDVVILQMGTFALIPEQAEASAAPAPAQPGQPTPTKAPSTKATQPAAAAAPVIPDVVTLIVSPQDAITLNYLMLAGANLNMVLRSAGDTEAKTTEAVTLQFILDQYQIPNPAKLPYAFPARMDAFPEKISAFPDPVNSVAPTK